MATVLDGGTPERTPLSIYDWNMGGITASELAARMTEAGYANLIGDFEAYSRSKYTAEQPSLWYQRFESGGMP